ncbi:hypothetical protein G6L37_00260 [Agrobacterium rubi]|nr:hypothetical protein [Agrobacterium rubi]NTF23683.1 hypothetical protein [Agrobacterium rubi]
MDKTAKAIKRLLEVEDYPFLLSPEYGLRVEKLRAGHRISAHPNSNSEEPGENRFVGGTTEVVLGIGLSDEELDTFFTILDNDIKHATEWMLADAQEGYLGDPADIAGWETLRDKDPVDYMMYLSGAGDEARNHTNAGDLSSRAAGKMRIHERERNSHGVLGKGLPRDARGHVHGDLMFGYNAALEYALDKWIRDGGLVQPVP